MNKPFIEIDSKRSEQDSYFREIANPSGDSVLIQLQFTNIPREVRLILHQHLELFVGDIAHILNVCD